MKREIFLEQLYSKMDKTEKELKLCLIPQYALVKCFDEFFEKDLLNLSYDESVRFLFSHYLGNVKEVSKNLNKEAFFAIQCDVSFDEKRYFLFQKIF